MGHKNNKETTTTFRTKLKLIVTCRWYKYRKKAGLEALQEILNMANQISMWQLTIVVLLAVLLQEIIALPVNVEGTQSAEEQSERYDPTSPIYELQLAVWPTDFEDIVEGLNDAVQQIPIIETQEVVYPDYETEDGSQVDHAMSPIYEDQFVIYPELDYEYDNLANDEEHVGIAEDNWWSTTTTTTKKPTKRPTKKPTKKPIKKPTKGPSVVVGAEAARVVERYHTVHPNGTSEYKLVLSNGMVNYKKIYNKRVKGKLVTVQKGYDTMPVPGHQNRFYTQYYIADETGHNVYKVEQHVRRRESLTFLDNKQSEDHIDEIKQSQELN